MEYLEILRKVQVSHNTVGSLYEQLAKIISGLCQVNTDQINRINGLQEQILTQTLKIENLQKRYERCPDIKTVKEVKPEPHSLLEILNIKSLREKPGDDGSVDKKLAKVQRKHKKLKSPKEVAKKPRAKRTNKKAAGTIDHFLQENSLSTPDSAKSSKPRKVV